MSDFKLKLILSGLGGIIFAFLFILLAFALPTKKNSVTYSPQPKNRLEMISHSLKK